MKKQVGSIPKRPEPHLSGKYTENRAKAKAAGLTGKSTNGIAR